MPKEEEAKENIEAEANQIYNKEIKDTNPIFKDREVLRPGYLPDTLPHREKELQFLNDAIKAYHNVFIYGKTGVGKTTTVKFLGEQLLQELREVNKKILLMYINCAVVDTQYRLLQNMTNHLIDEWDERIPFSGWSTDKVFNTLKEKLGQQEENVMVLILDEIDKLKGDEVLYKLTRLNDQLKNLKIIFVSISDDLMYTEFLDPETKNSLAETTLIFPSYNSKELVSILNERVKLAFEENTVDKDTISLIAALAEQDHGDANRAVELLYEAGKIVQHDKGIKDGRITKREVRLAQNRIEYNRLQEIIISLPTQSKLVLKAISDIDKDYPSIFLSNVYEQYTLLCEEYNTDKLTFKRVKEIVSEFDMLGIIRIAQKITIDVPLDTSILTDMLSLDSNSEHDVYNLEKNLKIKVNTDFSNLENYRDYIKHSVAQIINYAEGNTNFSKDENLRAIISHAIELDAFADVINDLTWKPTDSDVEWVQRHPSSIFDKRNNS